MNQYKKTMAQTAMPEACEERIRDMLTLGRKRACRPAGWRVVRVAAAAAAAVLLLMGGALAVSGGWSDLVDLFRARNGGAYTESQIARITELEENIGLSAESNGITVTVDSVLTTENTADVLLVVRGEGLELREDGNYSFYSFKYDMESDVSRYFVLAPRNVACECVGVTVEDEEYAAYILFHYEQTVDPDQTLQSGEYVLTLTLEDFYEYGESRGDEKTIYEGEWIFELPLKEISGEKVIVLEDAELAGWHREEHTAGKEEVVCLVDEVVIGVKSIILRYHAEDPLYDVHFDIQAVMKDGTVVSTAGGGGHGVAGDYTMGMQWEQLIDLTELDHLLVGGEIVPLPDEQ